jgi:response regulator RpfG family c-di-GMP phosphodiesterase
MQMAALTALDHHEKWDGSGYPAGKKGEEISIYGRFAAVSDVFDALTSHRCYKKAWPYEKALDFLKAESGRHFDPTLIDIFMEHADVMIKIKATLQD